MISKEENLLIVAMEECNEVGQALSKTLRFGPNSKDPINKKAKPHGNEVVNEFYQLQALIEELQYQGILPKFDREDINNIKHNKKRRVYRNYNIEKSHKKKTKNNRV